MILQFGKKLKEEKVVSIHWYKHITENNREPRATSSEEMPPTCCKSPHEVLGQFRGIGSRHNCKQYRVEETARNENILPFKSVPRYEYLETSDVVRGYSDGCRKAYGIRNFSAHDKLEVSRPKRAI